MKGECVGKLDRKLFFETLARILSAKYGMDITVKVKDLEEAQGMQDLPMAAGAERGRG